MNARLECLLLSETGPTVTEYAVMLALIVLISTAAIASMGPKVRDTDDIVKNNVPVGTAS